MPGESARARPTDATLTRARDILLRHDTQCLRMTSTASVEMIAREENVRPSTVWNWISVARGGPTVVGEPPTIEIIRPPTKPMSERAIAGRAWVTWHLDVRFRRLTERTILFWTEMVVAVHRIGDGFGLSFGDAGFDGRSDFAEACGGDAETLSLLARRKLIDDSGDAIALPRGLGITPRERVGGKLMPRSGADRRQGTLGPMGLTTSRPKPESDRSQPESEASDSGNAECDSDRSPAVLATGVDLAGGESTNTNKTKREDSPLFGVGQDIPGEREAKPDSGDSDPPDSGATPAGVLPHVALAADVLAIIGRPGHATPTDLNAVKTCLQSGGTPDGLRDFATGRMSRDRFRKDPPTVSYLARGYLDALTATPVIPAAPVHAPPAPEPPEDPAATIACLNDDPDNPLLVAAWEPLRASLKAQLTEAEYRTWVRDMKLGGLDGDEIVLLLPNQFACDRVRDHYGARIRGLWKQAYPEARRVDFRVASGA